MTNPTQSIAKLQTAFAQNRTEELGYDVWQQFVIPPFYDKLDLKEARKPRVIVGGRGCGKTMLLRFLSHESVFSKHRHTIPSSAIAHVGLYWRADTQFATLMKGSGRSTDQWAAAFNHLVALIITSELLDSLESIASSTAGVISPDAVESLTFERLRAFSPALGIGYQELRNDLEQRLWTFESWIANLGTIAQPLFLPGRSFVQAVIRAVISQAPQFTDTVFHVFVDEYENLLEYQQRIVNTYLKHSEAPLVFNLAMKRNGFVTKKTVGEESIVDVADYRTHDLESYILEKDFGLFAGEVLFLTLAVGGLPSPVSVDLLRDASRLDERASVKYRASLLQQVRRIFPGISPAELAARVIHDDALRRQLERQIRTALDQRKSLLSVSDFVLPEHPEATIVSAALLRRKRVTVDEVLAELGKLKTGGQNKFTGPTNWVHNNLVGCLLALYEPQYKVCPLYSGFDAFVGLSRGNLRHFLELCHKSLSGAAMELEGHEGGTTLEAQAQAARQVSAGFLGQVKSFGRLGNRLHGFVLSLGSLFALAHRRPTQSEPEICHFVVTGGPSKSESAGSEFILEAVKWSVVFEEEETKLKDGLQPASFEYVLNPIYAPYFNISFRKKRKLELTQEEFNVLAGGDYDKVSGLLRAFSRKWEIDINDLDPTLFTHLLGEPSAV
jgi:hypothetical protein